MVSKTACCREAKHHRFGQTLLAAQPGHVKKPGPASWPAAGRAARDRTGQLGNEPRVSSLVGGPRGYGG